MKDICMPPEGIIFTLVNILILVLSYFYRAGRKWFMINYYRKDPPFLSLEVPPHTHTPARFEMPASREKMSLNARD